MVVGIRPVDFVRTVVNGDPIRPVYPGAIHDDIVVTAVHPCTDDAGLGGRPVRPVHVPN